MEDVDVLLAVVEAGRKIGQVTEAHLYGGGLVSVEGTDFTLTFAGKEQTDGRAQDVCKEHH